MAAVYADLLGQHDAVALIGADAPQLQASELERAVQWLAEGDEERFVLGPAQDGGFWLFGGNRPLPLGAWTAPVYSQPDTAAQFRHAIGERRPWLELATLRDVDNLDDLPAVANALDALADALPAQRELAGLSRALLAERSANA
jgi:hypothetical protein